MNNRKNNSIRRKGTIHRQYNSRADRIKDENRLSMKREKLLVQAIVSAVMVLIVISISVIDTSLTSSIESRLEIAIKTSVTSKDLAVWKEQGQTAIEELGNNTGDFLYKLGIRKKVDKTNNKTNNKKNEEEKNTETKNIINENNEKAEEVNTKNEESKNLNPPEVILPES